MLEYDIDIHFDCDPDSDPDPEFICYDTYEQMC